jgi:hypothetical protein
MTLATKSAGKMKFVKGRKQSCYEILNLIHDKTQLTSEGHAWFCRAHKTTMPDHELYQLVIKQEIPAKLAGRMIGDKISTKCSRKPDMRELVSHIIQEYLLVEKENNPLLLIATLLPAQEQDELFLKNIQDIADRHITLLIRAFTIATLYKHKRGYNIAANLLSSIYSSRQWELKYPWHHISCEYERIKNLEKQVKNDIRAWDLDDNLIFPLLQAKTTLERTQACEMLEKVVSPHTLDEYKTVKWSPAALESSFQYWRCRVTNPSPNIGE